MTPSEAFPISEAEAQSINRRGLLCAAVASVAAVIGGEWLGALHMPGPIDDVVELSDSTPLAVGAAHSAKSMATQADVLVVRVDAQTVVAFDRRCPHLGCPVLWSAERARFECPCHAASFDARTGAVLAGPPRRGLSPVSIRQRTDAASISDHEGSACQTMPESVEARCNTKEAV